MSFFDDVGGFFNQLGTDVHNALGSMAPPSQPSPPKNPSLPEPPTGQNYSTSPTYPVTPPNSDLFSRAQNAAKTGALAAYQSVTPGGSPFGGLTPVQQALGWVKHNTLDQFQVEEGSPLARLGDVGAQLKAGQDLAGQDETTRLTNKGYNPDQAARIAKGVTNPFGYLADVVNAGVIDPITVATKSEMWFGEDKNPQPIAAGPFDPRMIWQNVGPGQGHNYLRDIFAPAVRAVTGEDVPHTTMFYAPQLEAMQADGEKLAALRQQIDMNPSSSQQDRDAYDLSYKQFMQRAQALQDNYAKSVDWWSNSPTSKTLTVIGQLLQIAPLIGAAIASPEALGAVFGPGILQDPIASTEGFYNQIDQAGKFVEILSDPDKRDHMTAQELAANISNIAMLSSMGLGGFKTVSDRLQDKAKITNDATVKNLQEQVPELSMASAENKPEEAAQQPPEARIAELESRIGDMQYASDHTTNLVEKKAISDQIHAARDKINLLKQQPDVAQKILDQAHPFAIPQRIPIAGRPNEVIHGLLDYNRKAIRGEPLEWQGTVKDFSSRSGVGATRPSENWLESRMRLYERGILSGDHLNAIIHEGLNKGWLNGDWRDLPSGMHGEATAEGINKLRNQDVANALAKEQFAEAGPSRTVPQTIPSEARLDEQWEGGMRPKNLQEYTPSPEELSQRLNLRATPQEEGMRWEEQSDRDMRTDLKETPFITGPQRLAKGGNAWMHPDKNWVIVDGNGAPESGFHEKLADYIQKSGDERSSLQFEKGMYAQGWTKKTTTYGLVGYGVGRLDAAHLMQIGEDIKNELNSKTAKNIIHPFQLVENGTGRIYEVSKEELATWNYDLPRLMFNKIRNGDYMYNRLAVQGNVKDFPPANLTDLDSLMKTRAAELTRPTPPDQIDTIKGEINGTKAIPPGAEGATGTAGEAGQARQELNSTEARPDGVPQGSALAATIDRGEGQTPVSVWQPPAQPAGALLEQRTIAEKAFRDAVQSAMSEYRIDPNTDIYNGFGRSLMALVDKKGPQAFSGAIEKGYEQFLKVRREQVIDTWRKHINRLDPDGLIKRIIFVDEKLDNSDYWFQPGFDAIFVNTSRGLLSPWAKNIAQHYVTGYLKNLKESKEVPAEGLLAASKALRKWNGATQEDFDLMAIGEELAHAMDIDHLSAEQYLSRVANSKEWIQQAVKSGLNQHKEGYHASLLGRLASWKSGGMSPRDQYKLHGDIAEYRAGQIKHYWGLPLSDFSYRLPEALANEFINPSLVKEGAEVIGREVEGSLRPTVREYIKHRESSSGHGAPWYPENATPLAIEGRPQEGQTQGPGGGSAGGAGLQSALATTSGPPTFGVSGRDAQYQEDPRFALRAKPPSEEDNTLGKGMKVEALIDLSNTGWRPSKGMDWEEFAQAVGHPRDSKQFKKIEKYFDALPEDSQNIFLQASLSPTVKEAKPALERILPPTREEVASPQFQAEQAKIKELQTRVEEAGPKIDRLRKANAPAGQIQEIQEDAAWARGYLEAKLAGKPEKEAIQLGGQALQEVRAANAPGGMPEPMVPGLTKPKDLGTIKLGNKYSEVSGPEAKLIARRLRFLGYENPTDLKGFFDGLFGKDPVSEKAFKKLPEGLQLHIKEMLGYEGPQRRGRVKENKEALYQGPAGKGKIVYQKPIPKWEGGKNAEGEIPSADERRAAERKATPVSIKALKTGVPQDPIEENIVQAQENVKSIDKAQAKEAKAKGDLPLKTNLETQIDAMAADPSHPLNGSAAQYKALRDMLPAARDLGGRALATVEKDLAEQAVQLTAKMKALAEEKAKINAATAPKTKDQHLFDRTAAIAAQLQKKIDKGVDPNDVAAEAAKKMGMTLAKAKAALKDAKEGLKGSPHDWAPAFQDLIYGKPARDVRVYKQRDPAPRPIVPGFTKEEVMGLEAETTQRRKNLAAARAADEAKKQAKQGTRPAIVDHLKQGVPSRAKPQPEAPEAVHARVKKQVEGEGKSNKTTKDLREETAQIHEKLNTPVPSPLLQQMRENFDQERRSPGGGEETGGAGAPPVPPGPNILDGWDEARDRGRDLGGKSEGLALRLDTLLKELSKRLDPGRSTQHPIEQARDILQAAMAHLLRADSIVKILKDTIGDDLEKNRRMAPAIENESEPARQEALKLLTADERATADMLHSYFEVAGRIKTGHDRELIRAAREHYLPHFLLFDENKKATQDSHGNYGPASAKMKSYLERRLDPDTDEPMWKTIKDLKEEFGEDNVEERLYKLFELHTKEFVWRDKIKQMIDDLSGHYINDKSFVSSAAMFEEQSIKGGIGGRGLKRGQVPFVGRALVPRSEANAIDPKYRDQMEEVTLGPMKGVLHDWLVYKPLKEDFERLTSVYDDSASLGEQAANLSRTANNFYKFYKFMFNPVHYYNVVTNVGAIGGKAALNPYSFYHKVWGTVDRFLQDDNEVWHTPMGDFRGDEMVAQIVKAGGVLPKETVEVAGVEGGLQTRVENLPIAKQYTKWMWHDTVWKAHIGLSKMLADGMAKKYEKINGYPPNADVFRNMLHGATLYSKYAVGYISKQEMTRNWDIYGGGLYLATKWSTTQLRMAFRALPQGIPGVKFMSNVGGGERYRDVLSHQMQEEGHITQKDLDFIKGMQGHMARQLALGGTAKLLAVSTVAAYVAGILQGQPPSYPWNNAQRDWTHTFDIYKGVDETTGKDHWEHNPLFNFQGEMFNYIAAGLQAWNEGKDPYSVLTAGPIRYLGKEAPALKTALDVAFNRNLALSLRGYGNDADKISNDKSVAAIHRALDAKGIPDLPGGWTDRLIYAVRNLAPQPGFAPNLEKGVDIKSPGDAINAMGFGKWLSIGDLMNAWQTDKWDNVVPTAGGHLLEYLTGSRETTSTSPEKLVQNQQIGQSIANRGQKDKDMVDMVHAAQRGDYATVNKIATQYGLTNDQLINALEYTPSTQGGILYQNLPYKAPAPVGDTILGHNLDLAKSSELEARRKNNTEAVIQAISATQAFQNADGTHRAAMMSAYLSLTKRAVDNQFAQEQGFLGGDTITNAQIGDMLDTAINFRSVVDGVLANNPVYQAADDVERQRMETSYGDMATNLAWDASFGNLKDMPLQNVAEVLNTTIQVEQATRSYLRESAFFQLADPGRQSAMMNEYIALARTIAKRSALGLGQGPKQNEVLDPKDIVPMIAYIMNTEESAKAVLRGTDFYASASLAEQTSLDHKYETMARSLAFSQTYVGDPRGVIMDSIAAEQAYRDLQQQFGGNQHLKDLAQQLSDQQKQLRESAAYSSKQIAALERVSRAQFLQQHPDYANWLRARLYWRKNTGVGQVYTALNSSEYAAADLLDSGINPSDSILTSGTSLDPTADNLQNVDLGYSSAGLPAVGAPS